MCGWVCRCECEKLDWLSLCTTFPHSVEGLQVCGYEFCPLLHLCLTQPPTSSREDSEQLLQQIVQECMDNGVAVVTSKYLQEETNLPPPR